MTDESGSPDLESRLRSTLAARDPGAPPVALAARIRSDRQASPGVVRGALGRVIGIAAAVAATALGIAVIAAVTVRRPMDTAPSPGSVGASVAPPFDPTADGSGIVAGGNESGPVVLLIVVVAVLALVAWSMVGRRWLRLLPLALAVGAVVAGLNLINDDYVRWTEGSWQYGLGFVETPDDPLADPTPRTPLFVVPPNGVLTFGLDVHNVAPVPITILGLAEDPRSMAWGHVSALGLLDDPDNHSMDEPSHTRAFAPTTVVPGDRLFLIVAGRASACAVDRPNTGSVGEAGASFGQIDVVYEILGVRRTTTVSLPFSPQLPMDAACLSR